MSRVLAALRVAPAQHTALCDDRRSMSYAELRSAVDRESRWLADASIDACALLADNGIGWIVADLSLMQHRSLHVPVPQWFTRGQIDHVVADARIDVVLTDRPERIERDHPEFHRDSITPCSQLTVMRRRRRALRSVPSAVLKVTYTSGSTGAAKGVCLGLEAMESVAASLADALRGSVTRHLCAMPLSTLLENIAGVYAPILLGATCIVPSLRTTGVGNGAFDAAAFVARISHYKPQSLIIPPELLRVLVVAAGNGWTPPGELRFIAVGGAAVSPALLEDAHALGLPAYQGYGLSECASVVCLNTPEATRRGSVGRVLPHARLRVDERGQLIVSGTVMQGYLGQDEAPVNEIATGDLGHVDADGFVYVNGRSKNMFITSMGRNVSPEWIEAELLSDPHVGQAVVFGEARPWPIALVRPAATATAADVERAVASCNGRLPAYARLHRWTHLPEALSFEDGLLTANGRPRRDVVAQRYAALIDSLYDTALAG